MCFYKNLKIMDGFNYKYEKKRLMKREKKICFLCTITGFKFN